MTPEEIAEQIEQSELTEDELNEMNWFRICGNLPDDEAAYLKQINPGSAIIKDELNPGMFLVMKFGYREE